MSGELAAKFNSLGSTCEGLSNLSKKIKISSQTKLFDKLSNLYFAQELSTACQGDLAAVYVGGAMKHYSQEH